MKARVRVGSAAVALALVSASPGFAQNSAAPAPPAEEVIGPPQLQNFSLDGRVTRPAEPAPERSQPAQPTTSASPAPAPSQRSAAAPAEAAPEAPSRGDPARRQARSEAPAQSSATAAADAFDFPPPTPAGGQPSLFGPAPADAQPAAAGDLGAIAPPPADSDGVPGSLLPWLLALLAAIGAGAWYFRRQRSGFALAGAGGNASAFDLGPSPAASQPQPRAPVPAAAPPAPDVPKGIVSTRLRPWLDIEFVPDQAHIDEERATVHFDIVVYNSGSAPARNVLVEAVLFNAGPDQDQSIGAFFARPVGQGDRVPVIPPLQRMSFRSAVSLPREQMRIFAAGGRSVFVPVIGFNALYSWGGGEGQTSASYIVGRDTNGEKMAPLRVEAGPRAYRPLAAREHTLRVRK